MRITFSEIKEDIGRVLNLCFDGTDDARLLSYINRACERLWYKAKWVDTYGRWRVCVNQSCLTWPREIETIEAISMDCYTSTIRNGWFEFLASGPGIQTTDSCGTDLYDRGNTVGFDEPTGEGKQLTIYADGSEDVTARIILRYKNLSGQKVYTTLNGETIEGESIALPTIGTYNTSQFQVYPAGLYEVVKPVTNFPIRLYEKTTLTGALKPLAYYEPDETVPSYRSSFIPGIAAGTVECASTSVIVMGKKRFKRVRGNNDIIPVPHTDAVRLACQAVFKEESNLQEDAVAFWALARQCLEEQLDHWQGDGVVAPLRMHNLDIQPTHISSLV